MKKLLSLFMLLVAIVTGAKAATQLIDFGQTGYGDLVNITFDDATNTAGSLVDATLGGSSTKAYSSAYSKKGIGTNFVTATSYTKISAISLYVSTTDKGKTYLQVDVCPNADFSSDVTTVQAGAVMNGGGLPANVSNNNQYYQESYNLETPVTGYVRVRVYENSGSSGKTINVGNISVTYTSGPSITTQPEGAAYVSGATMDALTVEATASAGTLTYQWYSCDDADKTNPEAIDGATSASYTPSAAGYYYVKITDSNGSVDSDVAQITVSAAEAPTISVSGTPAEAVKVGTEVTLTATATGVPTPTITWYNGSDEAVATVEGTELAYTVPTTTAGTYTFYAKASNGVGDDATSAVQTVVVKEQVATPTFTPNGAFFEGSQEVAIASATDGATIQYSTDNGESWNNYTAAFTVTATTTVKAKATKDGYIDSEEATATFTLVDLEPQADVTDAVTWDWNTVTNSSAVELDKSPNVLSGVDVTFANISAYGYTAVAGLAAQDALLMNGQRAYNNANGSKHCQVNYLKFNTTVAGKVTVEYANTGGNAARTVNVNGTKGTMSVTDNSTYKSEEFYVEVGEVEIKGVQVSDDADKMLRIRKVVFTPLQSTSINLNGSGFATYSSKYDFEYSGADAYGMKLSATSLVGTKVTSGKIKAGEGILFKGEAGATVTITETTGAEAIGDANNLIGTTNASEDIISSSAAYKYALSGDTFKTFTGSLAANKAFFGSDTAIGNSLELVFNEAGEATAVDAIAEADEAEVAPVKVIKNGKLYIGNFNVAGQQVK